MFILLFSLYFPCSFCYVNVVDPFPLRHLSHPLNCIISISIRNWPWWSTISCLCLVYHAILVDKCLSSAALYSLSFQRLISLRSCHSISIIVSHTPLPGVIVVQWWSWRSGYPMSLLCECWMVRVSYLTGVEHDMSHGFTPNHTPYMLICYPGFLIELQNCTSTRWGSGPKRIMHAWICYYIIPGVCGDTWTISDRWLTHQGLRFTSNYTPYMLNYQPAGYYQI